MKKGILFFLGMFFICMLFAQDQTAAKNSNDEKDCIEAEPTYMSRIPGFYISGCNTTEFNTYNFKYQAVRGVTIGKEVSGYYRYITYTKDEKEPRKISAAFILNNFYNAVIKAKGKSLSVEKDFYQMSQQGKNIYFRIEEASDIDERGFSIRIIEEDVMKQEVEVSLEEALEADGKIALYGILFDVGKSVIKPESAPALQEIIDYLTQHPADKIYIVGHTDNTGVFAANITLSKARAKAVKDYLITKGKIAATRLGSDGVGSLCPVATNSTDEGKQKNRRVEIVKQ